MFVLNFPQGNGNPENKFFVMHAHNSSILVKVHVLSMKYMYNDDIIMKTYKN